MIVTEEEVQRIYRRRFGEAEKKAKADVWKVIVQSFFQRWVRAGDVVVDLGCGYGEFLNFLRCGRRIGVDLNPDSQSHLDVGIEFYQKSVCDLSFLADNSVDFVFTSNLMEHLPGKREVEQMSREALRVLRPGGHFVMMGPNLRLLPGSYWDFWDHVVPITDRSLVECLENLNFDIADCFPRFLPYTTRSSLPQSSWLVRLFLAMPWAWRILGKQFLIRARKPALPVVSVVLPVYNESQNIVPCLNKLESALRDEPHEILVCYDFDGDTTLPAIAAMPERPASVRLVKNDLGRGVAFALQAGFDAARGDVVVSTMADLSDPPEVIPAMAAKIRAGADVVSGSRYMKGGSQQGGPLLKRTLSRIAGVSLWHVAGVGTHDATTNFRAYSAKFLSSHPIESTAGFEVALELTTKAQRDDARVDEVPSSWHDRTAGESRFNLKKWLPKYLYWYGRAMWQPAVIWGTLAAMLAAWLVIIHRYAARWPFWDELSYLSRTVGAEPITWELLWTDHNGHRILIPKLVYFAFMKALGYQSIGIMYFSVILLTFGIGCVLMAVRRTRGRMIWIDASLILAALAFSQYENLLWAFQLPFTMAATLVLLAIAAAVGTRHNRDRRILFLMGGIGAILPYFGGQGMGMAPGIFVWLLAVGVIYLVRGKTREERVFAATSLGCGIAAAAAWCVAIHGLPPSPAPQALLHAFHSWSTFKVFSVHFYASTVEFFSTPFLPESLSDVVPTLYQGWTWGVVGMGLLVSAGVILVVAWLRRPRERLRISAITACVVSFVILTLLVYLSRGIYGAGASAVPRYSTVAMPLVVMALVTYLLYAPKILRMVVPVLIGAATLVLLGGRYGNVEKLCAFSNMERDGYRAFSEEIRRPGGTTIEELSAHFSGPLFGPGDVRSVPEFIGLMAAHDVGPFRGTHIIPGHITEWRASPLDLHASDPQYGVNWDGTRATKSAGVFGVLTLATDKPLALSAIRLTFRVKPSSLHQVDVELAWNQAAGDPSRFNHEVRWICAPHDVPVETIVVHIFSTVDRFRVLLGAGLTEWELIKAERLEPAATVASTSR